MKAGYNPPSFDWLRVCLVLFELDHVVKYYPGKFGARALDDIVASVGEGAIGLLGPNGAGKSTLIKSLLGLVRISSGSARVLGTDVRRAGKLVREQIGYMPEDDCLVHGLKGIETVAYAAELAGLPYRAALRRAHEIIDYVGLGEARYREVQTFSTGMRQRIKLGLALAHAPKLLFLDEPTSGLDPDGRRQMLALIRELSREKGMSVVVSTHILTDIEQSCDAVMILGRGRLLVYDTIANLRQTDGTFVVRYESREPGALWRTLDGHGLRAERLSDTELKLHTGGDTVPARMFELAKQNDIAIRSIQASRSTLEQTFLAAVERQTTVIRATDAIATDGLAREAKARHANL